MRHKSVVSSHLDVAALGLHHSRLLKGSEQDLRCADLGGIRDNPTATVARVRHRLNDLQLFAGEDQG
jgi:hypothetical protein